MKQLLILILLISFVNASEGGPIKKLLPAKDKASNHYLSVAKKLDKRTTLSSILAETEEMISTDVSSAKYLKRSAAMFSPEVLRPGPYRPP